MGAGAGAKSKCLGGTTDTESVLNAVATSLGLPVEDGAEYDLEALETSDAMLTLLQRQLLLLLGLGERQFHVCADSSRVEELLKQDAAQKLLSNYTLLELFLSSGDCLEISRLSPKLPQDRWFRAVESMIKFIDYDPRITSGDPEDELRMRLAVGGALANSSPVVLLDSWEGPDSPCNEELALTEGAIDPLKRYDNYLRWYEEGKLFSTFGSLGAWQYRFLFICFQSDEDLEWAQENCQCVVQLRDESGEASKINLPGGGCEEGKGDVEYKDKNPETGASIHEGHEGYYGHKGHITLKEYHEIGGVCGAICFFATGMAQAFGIPARIVGQPGHCAMIAQKTPGHWYLGNDISGWSASHDCEGHVIWDIPLMEQALMNFPDYSKSERLRTAAILAPVEYRGDLLARASSLCPFNMEVWRARIEHIKYASASGHDCDADAWVGETTSMLKDVWFGKQSTIISKGKFVKTSDDAYDHMEQHLVDCGEASWCTKLNEGTIDVDLGKECSINRVSIHWCNMPNSYRILASTDAPSWPVEVSRGCKVSASEFEDMCQAVTDGEGFGGGDTIWYAEAETAWIVIDLGRSCAVTSMHIEWWGLAYAGSFVISSSSDGDDYTQQRTAEDATAVPKEGCINDWHGGIPGWSDATTHVKIELSDGHPDGWGHNKLFGVRNIRVMGYEGESKEGEELSFEEVRSSDDGTTEEGITCFEGWSQPTRVVRLELTDIGSDGECFYIKQFNVHGGINYGDDSGPLGAMDTLMEEVAYRLDKEIVAEKYYEGDIGALRTGLASESSSGKDRPLQLAVEHLRSLGMPGSGTEAATSLPSDCTSEERTHWLQEGFSCRPLSCLLVMERCSSQGENFHKSRNMCNNAGGGGWAEYTVKFPATGVYDVFSHYAAEDARPLCVHLDGKKQGKSIANGTTGGWYTTKWFQEKCKVVVDTLEIHTIRVDTDGFYPHISAILFSPADPDAPAPDPDAAPPTAEYEGEEFNGPESTGWEDKGYEPLKPCDYLMPMCTWETAKETFWRDRTQCGNSGGDGWAEFKTKLEPGSYKVFSHYASGDPRVLKFSLNGEELATVATEVTGGFGVEDMAWFVEDFSLEITEPEQTIRVEAPGFYPHISAFAFVRKSDEN